MYVVDRADADAVGRAHGGAVRRGPPGATMVVVAGLIDPRMLVEVELDAYRERPAPPGSSRHTGNDPPRRKTGRGVAVRVIPCLDVDAGRVIKGVSFARPARRRRPGGARRRTTTPKAPTSSRSSTSPPQRQPRDHLRRGPPHRRGGVHPAHRRRRSPLASPTSTRLLRAGADKVVVNTAAVARPELLPEASHRFGAQCVVLSVDARASPRRPPSGFEVTTHGGRRGTGLDAVEWAAARPELGAGEILLNSMDADGTRDGFDLEMIRAVRAAVDRAGHRQRRCR